MTARPWRAAAYWPMHPGRLYLASTAAKTRAGLDRFADSYRAAGARVDVWCVLPIPGVTGASQVQDAPPG